MALGRGIMKSLRLVLMATLLALPFAMNAKANAQVSVGIGVGPAVVASPGYFGPPACSWGYFPYYPYSCAPYGYYGSSWFTGGVFIGAGPWYHWGWYGHPGWGWRGYRPWNGGGWHGGYAGGRAVYGGNGWRGGLGRWHGAPNGGGWHGAPQGGNAYRGGYSNG